MAVGTHDFQFLDFGRQDVAAISQQSTAAGVSFADILTAANRAMAATTSGLDPIVAAVSYTTEEETTDEEFYGNFQVQYGSEYAVPMPQMTQSFSHALPMRNLDVATQFTEDFLENASLMQILKRLNAMTVGFQRTFEHLVLMALFDPTAVPLTENSSTLSPKFVGYDANDPVYGKVMLGDGTVITSPYSHYFNDTPANLEATIDAMLAKHIARGTSGPFDIVGTQNAIDAITSLSSFLAADDPLVQAGQGDAAARVDANVYAGVLRGKNIRVRLPVTKIQDDGTTFWFSLLKTYGANAAGNPVAWRHDRKHGPTPYIRSRSMYPLDYAMAKGYAGFSAGNRFGATLAKIETTPGGYTAPSITG